MSATWLRPDLAAAFLSAVAATAAAIATWRGPISAARLADTLQRDGRAEEEARRFKLNVFAILMQERAQIFSADAVKALNSIDLAFNKCVPVREAWAELFQALNTNPAMPDHVLDERIRKLLREMAIDLEIADRLRLDDFGRVYYPNALAQEQQVRQLERAAALARLQQTSPAANTAAIPDSSLWPPKPKAE